MRQQEQGLEGSQELKRALRLERLALRLRMVSDPRLAEELGLEVEPALEGEWCMGS